MERDLWIIAIGTGRVKAFMDHKLVFVNLIDYLGIYRFKAFMDHKLVFVNLIDLLGIYRFFSSAKISVNKKICLLSFFIKASSLSSLGVFSLVLRALDISSSVVKVETKLWPITF